MGLTTRRLRYAIAASLLLHLLLFWPDGPHLLNQDAPALLQATLSFSHPAVVTPSAPPRASPHAVVPARSAEITPATPRSISAPNALEQSAPVSVPPALAPPPVPAVKSATAAAAVAPAGSPVSASASAGSPAGALLTDADASGATADGLRGYRLAVATQARRFRRYPAQAMAYGWEGSADVRVEVGRDGQPRAATVTRSSGHEVLDRAAQAMIDAAAVSARLPESLRGRAFAIVLPVVFNLDGE